MDLQQVLQSLHSKALEAVRAAAHRGRADDVLVQGRTLSRIEDLIKQYETLEAEVRDFVGESADAHVSRGRGVPQVHVRLQNDGSEPGPRQRGKQRRRELLSYLEDKGSQLQPIGGAIHQTRSGQRVGIAYASERRPDRWFLGLPEEDLGHAILLCEARDESVEYLFVPQEVMLGHQHDMSRSKGQLKFNVSRRDGAFFLIIPGSDPVKLPLLDQCLNRLE